MVNIIIVFDLCIILVYIIKLKLFYILNNFINYRIMRLVCDMRCFCGF